MGNASQRLRGTLDSHTVLAVPDSGAERNVIDLDYAIEHGFQIRTGAQQRNYLQFADGSIEETVGQVFTVWTFETGETIPVVLEVLKDCCSEVVIGEEILYYHDVYNKHVSSLVTISLPSDSYDLAPFDFLSSWQQKISEVAGKLKQKMPKGIQSVSSQHIIRRSD